ncbi:MAG: hypothetical protein N2317_03990 [Syntrophales bacterium]|nr:hypothetical protein [Syntrophales bacterium]
MGTFKKNMEEFRKEMAILEAKSAAAIESASKTEMRKREEPLTVDKSSSSRSEAQMPANLQKIWPTIIAVLMAITMLLLSLLTWPQR